MTDKKIEHDWEQVFYVNVGELCYYSTASEPYTGGGVGYWVDNMKIPVNGGDMQDVVLVEFIGEPYGQFGYIKANLRLATDKEIELVVLKERHLMRVNTIKFFNLPNNSLELALKIAENGHADQLDKQGYAYIDHVNAVVEGCESEQEKIVAAMHDLVEDTHFTLIDLSAFFDKEIIDAVDAITHRDKEERLAYLKRVKANKLALAVKKADVLNNVKRLPGLKGTPDYDRLAHKYLETVIYIYT